MPNSYLGAERVFRFKVVQIDTRGVTLELQPAGTRKLEQQVFMTLSDEDVEAAREDS